MTDHVLVSFDIDGTLMICDNARVHRAAFRAATFSLTGEDKPVEEYLGIPLSGCTDSYVAEKVLKKFLKTDNIPEEHFVKFMKKTEEFFLDTFDDRLDLMPGVTKLLTELNKIPNVTLAICSGNYPRIGLKKLESANLIHFFKNQIAGWGFHPNRADILRDSIKEAKKVTGHDFTRIIHVGDAPQDAQAAIDTGSIPVIVRTSRHKFHTSDFPKSSIILTNFEQNLDDFIHIVKTGALP
ncbi:haloacid dehalogenase-like hydrolase family protein [Tritrichomonas foetus]|uniref:Haloacid dehalogenase-like hydrolase family protein n=1 Tax=Tritrichomonas foetus TaxID=1144522 RepID=A0A1J4J1H1_9EUKA|nr:haloacid dehalogenase-like hydrolase family protein [Tritrichomonas foetus]|eukprot:OHS93274.1 haloacid dehalogenase-like hydrolase family protein [Tritrichomonas foetus]